MQTESLEHLYKVAASSRNRTSSFMVFPDGSSRDLISSLPDLNLFKNGFEVVPGSFNPLHKAHRAIFDNIPKSNNEFVNAHVFELSIHRKDKPVLSFEDIKERLKQFEGYATVWVTNASLYLEKSGLVSCWVKPSFHIGYDTAERLVRDHGIVGVQGIKANFTVYDRMINEEILTIANIVEQYGICPDNMQRGKPIDTALIGISSTSLRSEGK